MTRREQYQDLAEEMREHLEERTEQFVREGMPRKEAEQAARRAFGNAALLEERSREVWQWQWLENLLRDLNFSARLLRKSPGFAVIAILTLTLGVGANTSIFSLLNGLLLRPLPVPDAQQLVLFRLKPGNFGNSFCEPIFRALEAHGSVFRDIFAFAGRPMQVRGPAGNETVPTVMVSGQYFDALATQPEIGRYLTPADDRNSSNPSGYAAVISDGYWKTHFDRASDIIGRKLTVEDVTFTIVGVMPATFIGDDANSRPQIYIPLASESLLNVSFNGSAKAYQIWWLRVGGRLAPGASLAQANAVLSAIVPPIAREVIPDPKFKIGTISRDSLSIVAESGSTGYSSLRLHYRDPLLVTFALCAAVLLLACINIASLLLARSAMREREIATRLAIGATRRRLIQQLLIDSLLLSVLGTAAGLAVAPLASRALVAMLVGSHRNVYLDASLDGRVFLFAALAAILSTVLVGLLPALQATAGDLNRQMKVGARSTRGEHRRLLPKILLVTEVAIAMVLVAGAGLLATSLVRLYRAGLGFDPHGLVLVNYDMDKQPLEGEALTRLYQDLAVRLAQQPGVSSVAYSSVPPLSGTSWTGTLHLAGGADHDVYEGSVGPDYFHTMRIPVPQGREYTWQDTPQSTKKIILNQAAAKMFFPDGNAIGGHVNSTEDKKQIVYEIIGVAGNTKYTSLRDPAPPTVYLPITQETDNKPGYVAVLRTSEPFAPLAASVRQITTSLVPNIPSPLLDTMDSQVDESVTSERVMALLAVFFAASALLVTGIGLYGVLAYSTARRTSEIGIRMALGAERSQVISLIFRENAWISAAGVLVGLISAIFASRVLATFLYGTSARDPWVLLSSLTLLCLIAAIASLIPATRAASIDPMKALRSE